MLHSGRLSQMRGASATAATWRHRICNTTTVRVSTQKVHPANPATIQNCEEAVFCMHWTWQQHTNTNRRPTNSDKDKISCTQPNKQRCCRSSHMTAKGVSRSSCQLQPKKHKQTHRPVPKAPTGNLKKDSVYTGVVLLSAGLTQHQPARKPTVL
jgi:hypothetical protein